jgi:hypothetical protein
LFVVVEPKRFLLFLFSSVLLRDLIQKLTLTFSTNVAVIYIKSRQEEKEEERKKERQ